MITVITPTLRPKGLEVVRKCLTRQTIQDFEWIVVHPADQMMKVFGELGDDKRFKNIIEPKKNKGDYYSLNKAWNKAYSQTKGDLIVNIVDYIWFPPDTLERLLSHYKSDPKGLVTTVGHQYREVINGKPDILVWRDPRVRMDQGSFYEVAPSEMEMCICSIPKQAILDCGGLDEIYDTCPAVSEKEMCWRLDKLGYNFYIDQSIEYRALQHERLKTNWDQMYKDVTTPLFTKHVKELNEGTRQLNVGFVKP